MPQLSYEEITEFVHAIKGERTVLLGAVLQLNKADGRLEKMQDNLNKLIGRHEEEDI